MGKVCLEGREIVRSEAEGEVVDIREEEVAKMSKKVTICCVRFNFRTLVEFLRKARGNGVKWHRLFNLSKERDNILKKGECFTWDLFTNGRADRSRCISLVSISMKVYRRIINYVQRLYHKMNITYFISQRWSPNQWLKWKELHSRCRSWGHNWVVACS